MYIEMLVRTVDCLCCTAYTLRMPLRVHPDTGLSYIMPVKKERSEGAQVKDLDERLDVEAEEEETPRKRVKHESIRAACW